MGRGPGPCHFGQWHFRLPHTLAGHSTATAPQQHLAPVPLDAAPAPGLGDTLPPLQSQPVHFCHSADTHALLRPVTACSVCAVTRQCPLVTVPYRARQDQAWTVQPQTRYQLGRNQGTGCCPQECPPVVQKKKLPASKKAEREPRALKGSPEARSAQQPWPHLVQGWQP